MFKITKSSELAQIQQDNIRLRAELRERERQIKTWDRLLAQAASRAKKAEDAADTAHAWAEKLAHFVDTPLDTVSDDYLIHLAGYAKSLGQVAVLTSLTDELSRRGITTRDRDDDEHSPATIADLVTHLPCVYCVNASRLDGFTDGDLVEAAELASGQSGTGAGDVIRALMSELDRRHGTGTC